MDLGIEISRAHLITLQYFRLVAQLPTLASRANASCAKQCTPFQTLLCYVESCRSRVCLLLGHVETSGVPDVCFLVLPLRIWALFVASFYVFIFV